MNKHSYLRAARLRSIAIIVGFTLLVGCAGKKDEQASFKTADEAVGTLIAALQKGDAAELRSLLGPGTDALLSSGDAVADKADGAAFLASYQKKHSLAADGADKRVLVVGDNDWPLPIPIVRHHDKWYLDGAAGADEIIFRRVGSNELGAIDVCRGYVSAQLEYAAQAHDGDPAGIYALKLMSDAGLQNGLYWETSGDEPPSPAGPFVAAAAEEGYTANAQGEHAPYHGYYYRMLYAQGANANGGARDYFKSGVLTEGFALIAWPAEYGSSGVQTFIVNRDGVVFQKDLGADTAKVVETIQPFETDSAWKAIAPPAETTAAAP